MQDRQQQSQWRSLVEQPNWLPYTYDARADSLVFADLPRETQQRAVFLDPRFLAQAPKSEPAPLRDLPVELIRQRAGPIHFIFHTGFCCSTLLARAFDLPGISMGVKEPYVLVNFANLMATARRTPGADAALGLTLDLLSRPLAEGETQIIKANNVCNHIIPLILQLRPDAKAILLHSSLDAFLRAVARRSVDGRIWGRQTFQQFDKAIPLDIHFTDEETFQHTDLQIAARSWLMQAAFFDSIARRHGPSRVRLLSTDTLLDNKAEVLGQVGRFFGLHLSAKDCADIANGPVFHEHSKHRGQPFDGAMHDAQLNEVGALHFDELNAVRAWAKHLADRANSPYALTDTLFEPLNLIPA